MIWMTAFFHKEKTEVRTIMCWDKNKTKKTHPGFSIKRKYPSEVRVK